MRQTCLGFLMQPVHPIQTLHDTDTLPFCIQQIAKSARAADHQQRLCGGLPNVVVDVDNVVGKRTTRAIKAGVILRTDMVELPPLVKRGDVVVIIAESEGLKVTALGKAKHRGHRGEKIAVENLDSRKEVFARVLDASTVKVDF